ncbi:hypothetical protein BCV69DRAFT_82534 [Microstroma glucosiphilum]|uniref:Uncharacterized protein n=1 Tax=Pseudomicrostroma glucosiphilum TaxID=1684307 RepID=A0A316TYN4_9BASI|nr:hypothetical protein BCV69DRAFT_82534 [Pseudomicrostroma glucosiphilum]PWN18332.1 hypothetical protein BCV69DRAFT_82534 [Pseudomicrostroma glucosiphilum]
MPRAWQVSRVSRLKVAQRKGTRGLGHSTKPAKNKAPRLEQLRPQISLYYSPTRATATSYQSYEVTAETMSTTLSRKRPRSDIATASAHHGVMAVRGSNENPIVIEDGEDDESETGIEDEEEDEGVDEPEWSSDDPYEEVVTDEDQDEEEQEENNEGEGEDKDEDEDEDEGADEYEWSSDDPYEEVVTDEEQDEGEEDDKDTANDDRRQRR